MNVSGFQSVPCFAANKPGQNGNQGARKSTRKPKAANVADRSGKAPKAPKGGKNSPAPKGGEVTKVFGEADVEIIPADEPLDLKPGTALVPVGEIITHESLFRQWRRQAEEKLKEGSDYVQNRGPAGMALDSTLLTLKTTGRVIYKGVKIAGNGIIAFIPTVVHTNAHLAAIIFLPEKLTHELYIAKPEVRSPDHLPTKLKNALAGSAPARWYRESETVKKLQESRVSAFQKRLSDWLFRNRLALKWTEWAIKPLASPATAVRQLEIEKGDIVGVSENGKVKIVANKPKSFNFIRRMAARLWGEELPKNKHRDKQTKLPIEELRKKGTVSLKEIEQWQEWTNEASHDLDEKKVEYRGKLRRARMKKWLTRMLAAPAAALAFNIATVEGIPIAWTEWRAGYETLGSIRETYYYLGGIPHLHPKGFLVQSNVEHCDFQIVDPWTKLRYWCLSEGNGVMELRRLPYLPLIGAVEWLDLPHGAGMATGNSRPANDITEVQAVVPTGNPFTLKVEEFSKEIRAIPVARIHLKRPEDLENPEHRRIVESWYRQREGQLVLNETGRRAMAGFATLILDPYISQRKITQQKRD